MPITNEDQELLQDPSVGPYSSFRLASLLALKVTELLNQVGELLRHGLGPPPRATTTFSLIVSIRRHHPGVKRPQCCDQRVGGACDSFLIYGGVRPHGRSLDL